MRRSKGLLLMLPTSQTQQLSTAAADAALGRRSQVKTMAWCDLVVNDANLDVARVT